MTTLLQNDRINDKLHKVVILIDSEYVKLIPNNIQLAVQCIKNNIR